MQHILAPNTAAKHSFVCDRKMNLIGFIVVTSITTIQNSEAACSSSSRYSIIDNHSACLAKSSSAQTSGVSAAEKTEIVDRHNYHRSNVNPTARDMLKMSWDDDVAAVAQAYADNCVYEHDGNYQRILPGLYNAGQNLAVYTGSHSWTPRIDHWHSEVDHFTFGSGSTTGAAVGHYTQMVWAKSHKIGCGYAYCTNSLYAGNPGHLYVCNYSPAGNIAPNTNSPYTVGATCGDCPNSRSGNLCDCSSHHCYNEGTFNIDTCTCSCKDNAAFYVGASCVLNCTGITHNCAYTSLADWSKDTYCPNYANVPFECPYQCGWCTNNVGDSTSYLDSTMPPSGSSTTTPPSGSSTTGTTQGAGGGHSAYFSINTRLIFLLILFLFVIA